MFKSFQKSLINIKNASRLIKVKNKKLKIIYSVFLSNLVVLLDLGIIYLFTSFFQDVILPNSINFINLDQIKLFLPFLIILRFVVIYLDTMNIHNLRLSIEEKLKIDFLNEVFLRGNFSTSDSYFFVNTLCNHVANFYQNFSILITSFVKILLFTSFLLFTQPSTVLYFFIGFIVLVIPLRYFTKLNRKYSHISFNSGIAISDDIERVVDNLYLIKILKNFKNEKKVFQQNLNDYYSSQLNNLKYGSLNSLVPSFMTMIFLSVLFLFTALATRITLEFIAIILRLFQSLGEFNRVLSLSIATYVHLEKFLTIEKNKENIFSENFKVAENGSNVIASIENVNFKYLDSNQFIFKGLNIEINKNTHTIITGPNGVGKSTLLGLISGVFYAEKGRVLLNTFKTSYVSAYPMIIRGSLRENILYGITETIPDSEIKKEIDNFKLFDNNDIDLNDSVSNKTLSSGQMQKIAFIRAILSKPDLLLLDESTSNLDNKSKLLVYKILDSLNITIVNSTHSSDELINYDKEIRFSNKNGITEINEFKSL